MFTIFNKWNRAKIAAPYIIRLMDPTLTKALWINNLPHRRDPCHGNHHGMKPQSIIKMKMQHRIHRSGSPAERAIDMKPIMQDANRDDRENRCCANAKKRKQHDRKSRRHMKRCKPNQRCSSACHAVFSSSHRVSTLFYHKMFRLKSFFAKMIEKRANSW